MAVSKLISKADVAFDLQTGVCHRLNKPSTHDGEASAHGTGATEGGRPVAGLLSTSVFAV